MTKLIKITSCAVMFAIVLIALSAFPAQAQKRLFPAEEQKKPDANEIYKQLPPEDQQRLIEEATHVHDYCNKRDLFATFHDCRCVAAEFWEERILNYNPAIDPISVADKVADACPNIPGAAGYGYNLCVKIYKNRMPYGLQDYCDCYGRTFAKLYQKDPRAFMPNLTGIGSASGLSCAEKVHPNPFDRD